MEATLAGSVRTTAAGAAGTPWAQGLAIWRSGPGCRNLGFEEHASREGGMTTREPRRAEQLARMAAAEGEVFAHYGVEVTSEPLILQDLPFTTRVVRLGSGPPTVLLHGGALASTVWAPLLAFLPGRSLLLVDLPGCGFADPLDLGAVDLARHQTAFVGGVLDALGLPRASLIGASMGGWYALRYTIEQPDRVAASALVTAPAVALPGAVMPVLLLWGERDKVQAPEAAARAAGRLPRGRLEVLPGGHGLWFEHPERCGELLTGFLHTAEAQPVEPTGRPVTLGVPDPPARRRLRGRPGPTPTPGGGHRPPRPTGTGAHPAARGVGVRTPPTATRRHRRRRAPEARCRRARAPVPPRRCGVG